jgi:hypothetical protein
MSEPVVFGFVALILVVAVNVIAIWRRAKKRK